MPLSLTRRELLGASLAIAGLSSRVGAQQTGGAAPPLDPADPTAKALGFAVDTTKVDQAANPAHQVSQHCGVCAQFQGKPGDARGGCNIFPGKSVPQNGWCRVWAARPS
jgi:hypothetical protein